MKNKTITLLLISMITILSIAGCGKKDGSSSDNGSTSSYTSAVEILNVIWDNFPESDKFEVIGGGTGNAVENKAGSVDVTDTDTLKTDILGARFMCGFPERLVIISTGDYVAYAYGADDLVTTFKDIASEKIEGVKVEVDQLFE